MVDLQGQAAIPVVHTVKDMRAVQICTPEPVTMLPYSTQGLSLG